MGQGGSKGLHTWGPKAGKTLLSAAKAGNFHAMEEALKQNVQLLNHVNLHWRSPLYYAAREGHLEAVTVILDVLKSGGCGLYTELLPLERSSRSHRTANGIRRSASQGKLEFEQVLNRSDKKGHTPLMAACQKGHVEVASLLIREGANIITFDRCKRRSCLHLACINGQQACVSLLLASQIVLTDGRSQPLHMLRVEEGHRGRIRYIDYRSSDGFAAIHYAAFNGYQEIVRMLLAAGASILMPTSNHQFGEDIPCDPGTTAFHLAAMRGHDDILLLLLEAYVVMMDNAGVRAGVRLAWEGNRRLDPRLIRTTRRVIPQSTAYEYGRMHTARLLDPATPISYLISQSTGVMGVRRLASIATSALRTHLQEWLRQFEAEQCREETCCLVETKAPPRGVENYNDSGIHEEVHLEDHCSPCCSGPVFDAYEAQHCSDSSAPQVSLVFKTSRDLKRTSVEARAVSASARAPPCELGSPTLSVYVDDDDDNECGICMNTNRRIALRPCGHLMCGKCAKAVVDSSTSPARCPFCREFIGGFQRLDQRVDLAP